MKGDDGDLDSFGSSTIGGNSDDNSGRSSEGEETEVQSSYKGPLDSMDALEEVLPIRRGISKFYNGKSKSFTCLSETSVSSVQEIAKPENPFNRKRKNLLASSFWDNKPKNYHTVRNSGSGISKKLSKSSRSTLDLQATSSSSESINNSEDSKLISSSRLPPRPPQPKTSPSYISSSPPRQNTPRRSFSFSDLQCAGSGAPRVD